MIKPDKLFVGEFFAVEGHTANFTDSPVTTNQAFKNIYAVGLFFSYFMYAFAEPFNYSGPYAKTIPYPAAGFLYHHHI